MVINLISGPRNISTALMYSFAQRTDTKVIDEPFYAYYLSTNDIEHPGREEILGSMPKDPDEVLQAIDKLQAIHEVVFLKNMAHHHEGLNWDHLLDMKNVFLIRDPKQLIASFAQVITDPTIQDIGLKHEADLLDYLISAGRQPIVVDANNVLADPNKGLSNLCDQLGIAFDPVMLHWKEGALPEDGVWAKYWYKNVHHSTGFAPQKTSVRPLPSHCESLYEEALPYYEKLARYI